MSRSNVSKAGNIVGLGDDRIDRKDIQVFDVCDLFDSAFRQNPFVFCRFPMYQVASLFCIYMCVFSVYLRYNGSLCSGMASVGRFKHKSSLGNTDSVAKAQSVQTDIQVHSHNFKSFMAQLVNLGLDPDSNTANIDQTTATITRLSSIDSLFLDEDVVTINFMYFSNGTCLSHCEHHIDQTANNTSLAIPTNISSIFGTVA